MTVVIVHYHLRAGGVTRVIERQINALRSVDPAVEIVILAGSPPLFTLHESVKVIVDDSFSYCAVTLHSAAELAQREVQILQRLCSFSEEAIFHVHNPSLGKSLPLTAALKQFAQKGRRLFYHCHDFAEERPLMMAEIHAYCELKKVGNYRSLLYPSCDNITYLLANKEDCQRTVLSDLQTIYMPNPVVFNRDYSVNRVEMSQRLTLDVSKKWLLYPVRAITRKNCGELLLLSLLYLDHFEWLVTLAPENPNELEQYEKWCSLVSELALPIHFNVASHFSIESLMSCADAVVSTSYKEGFGMAFLEPWLVGKAVYGRRIDQVISDFEERGVRFNGLYKTLMVPVQGDEWKDFSLLGQEEQITSIRHFVTSPDYGEKVLTKNSWIINLFDAYKKEDLEHNRSVIEKEYSLTSFGSSLRRLYKL